MFVTVQTDLGYLQVWRPFYYRASQQITLLKNKKYITGGGGALQCSTTIPANMEEKVKDPSCWGDIMIALMHQGYPGHLALFCEMWKLWLGEKVSPYLEKNPTHHHPSQIWPLHSKLSVISVTEKSKAGGNFLSKKMQSNCKWVYLKWKRQHFHSKCILLKMQTCQACKLSIWIDQTQAQDLLFPISIL